MRGKTVGEAIYHLMGWSNVDLIQESIPCLDPNMEVEELCHRLLLSQLVLDDCTVFGNSWWTRTDDGAAMRRDPTKVIVRAVE